MSALSRKEWQILARARLDDANFMLRDQRWTMGYYLCGLSVEMALKSVIARQFMASRWPDKAVVNKIHTHDLPALATLAKIKPALENERSANGQFELYWRVASTWDVESRYKTISENEAVELKRAVTHRQDGVMRWIRTYW